MKLKNRSLGSSKATAAEAYLQELGDLDWTEEDLRRFIRDKPDLTTFLEE